MVHEWIKYTCASTDLETGSAGWICKRCFVRRSFSDRERGTSPLPGCCSARGAVFDEGRLVPYWVDADDRVRMPPAMPNTVRLFGLNFHLEEVDTLTEGTIGVINARRARISIVKDAPHGTKASTVLHEFIHVISEALQLGLNEKTTCRLEAGLTALLRDNRNTLVPFLTYQPDGEES